MLFPIRVVRLVLAQHLDDLAESMLMSAFHNGRLRTMKACYVNKGEVRQLTLTSFWTIYPAFLRPHATPQPPCDVFDFVPNLSGADLVRAIRWDAPYYCTNRCMTHPI